jgi:hypothetical protein
VQLPYLELLHSIGQATSVDEEDIWLLLQQNKLTFTTDAITLNAVWTAQQ